MPQARNKKTQKPAAKPKCRSEVSVKHKTQAGHLDTDVLEGEEDTPRRVPSLSVVVERNAFEGRRFQLREELAWTEEMQEPQEAGSYLDLNLSELALAQQSIPFHERSMCKGLTFPTPLQRKYCSLARQSQQKYNSLLAKRGSEAKSNPHPTQAAAHVSPSDVEDILKEIELIDEEERNRQSDTKPNLPSPKDAHPQQPPLTLHTSPDAEDWLDELLGD